MGPYDKLQLLICSSQTFYLSLSLRFNGHSPGEPGLAGVYWSKGWWKWWWQLELKVVQSSSQIITTNKPTPSLFLQAGCPSGRPTNSVKALKGKYVLPDMVNFCCSLINCYMRWVDDWNVYQTVCSKYDESAVLKYGTSGSQMDCI